MPNLFRLKNIFRRSRTPEEYAIEWLVRLNSPYLNDTDKNAFFHWLNASPINQAAYIEAERLSLSCDKAALKLNHAPSNRSFYFPGWKPVMASVVLGLSILLYSYYSVFNSNLELQEYQTSVGQQKQVNLEDGSSLWLNTKTKVRIEKNKSNYIAFLDKGEVLFNITPNSNRYFDVQVNGNTVRVLGTTFSVSRLKHGTLVTVMEGEVAVGEEAKASDQFSATVTLKNNQQLNLNNLQAGVLPSTVDSKKALAWREGRLIYRGEPLEHVVNDLNRYFETQIEIADESLKDNKVLVTLSLENNVDVAVSKLTLGLGIQAQADTARNVITLIQ